jgi:hypothetical protein
VPPQTACHRYPVVIDIALAIKCNARLIGRVDLASRCVFRKGLRMNASFNVTASRLRGRSALIVEDSRTVAQALETLLQDAGMGSPGQHRRRLTVSGWHVGAYHGRLRSCRPCRMPEAAASHCRPRHFASGPIEAVQPTFRPPRTDRSAADGNAPPSRIGPGTREVRQRLGAKIWAG